MFEQMLHDIRRRGSIKLGSNAARRPRAAPHIQGLYFLGKGDILPITNRCDSVLSVSQIGVLGFNDLMSVAQRWVPSDGAAAASDGSSIGCM
jgi:hypothetical protein